MAASCQSVISSVGYSRGLALLLAVAVDVGVGQDPVQPRLEVRSLAERAEAGVGLHHGFLQQVLGVGRVASHSQRTAVELVEQRNRVALEPRGQLGVGLRWLYRAPTSLAPYRAPTRRCRSLWEHRPFCCGATKQARYVHRTFQAHGRHQRPLPSILEAVDRHDPFCGPNCIQ